MKGVCFVEGCTQCNDADTVHLPASIMPQEWSGIATIMRKEIKKLPKGTALAIQIKEANE
jgi:hypothetical protein